MAALSLEIICEIGSAKDTNRFVRGCCGTEHTEVMMEKNVNK